MKPYLKKYLSVVMAVLMLLSSFVFVSPNKAEAVGTGQYHVELWIQLQEWTSQNKSSSVQVFGKANNGTGLTEQQIYSSSSDLTNFFNTYRSDSYYGQRIKAVSFDTNSFPTRFSTSVTIGSGNVNYFVYMYVKNNLTGQMEQVTRNDQGDYADQNNINGYCSAGSGCNAKDTAAGAQGRTLDDKYPRISSVDVSGSDTLTIPKDGSSSFEYRTYAKDQYGVRIGGATRGALSLSSTQNSTTGFSASYGNTTSEYDPVTVSVTSEAKSRTYDINTVSLSSTYSFNGASATGSKTILAYDPTYTMTFNPNGAGATISPNGTIQKQYYNQVASEITGKRTGYELIGLFPTQIADNYDADKPTLGQGLYVGALTAPILADRDGNFYAAWWAKNANAVFTDQNGKQIAVVPAKYGKTLTPAEVATVPAQEYHKLPGETGTFDYVFSGWAVESAKDDNGNDITAELAGKTPTEVTLQGETVFKPVFSVSKNSYTIKFHEVSGNVTSEALPYRAEPTVAPDQSIDATGEDYEIGFKGWTKVPTDGDNRYHTVDANGNCVNTGTYIPIESSFTVRGDAEYYPVFQKTFEVNFVNEDGTVLETKRYPQGAQAVPPEETPTKAADDTYTYTFAGWKDGDEFVENYIVNSNRTFTAAYTEKLIEYTVTVTDEYGLNTETQTLHYGDPITYVDDVDRDGYTYNFEGWADGAPNDRTCVGNATYAATYNKIPAVYEIKFVSHDATQSAHVNHNEYLQENDIPDLNGTFYIDTNGTEYKGDDVKYTFVEWLDENGNNPSTSDVVTSRNTYTAQYKSENVIPVTYYNGTQIAYKDYAFEGDTLPAFKGDTPTKADDVYNTEYKFSGWQDADGAAAPEVMGKDAVNLYAQFNGKVVKYEVRFERDDGTPIQTQILEYGWRVEAPEVPTTEDATFEYQFQSWSPEVESICVKNATYTAVFKKVRVLYEVTFIVDGQPLRVQKFINGAKIVPPMNPTTNAPIDDDHEWKFVGWERTYDHHMYDGDRIEGENLLDKDKKVSYEAKFEKVSKAFTVTFVNYDGEVIQTVPGVSLNAGLIADIIDVEQITTNRDADETNHYVFDGWALEDGTKVDYSTTVTGNMTLKATYRSESHKVKTEFVTAPSFDNPGAHRQYCEICYYELSDVVEIPALTDNVAPSGIITIDEQTWGKDPTEVYAPFTPLSVSSYLTINTVDKGDIHELYNPNANGSGIKKIELSAQESLVDVNSIPENEWKVFSTGKKQVNQLNYNIHLSEIDFMKDKTNGYKFAVYVRVTDYKDNVTLFNTTMLVIDEEPPVITIIKTQPHKENEACDKVVVTVSDSTECKIVVKHGGVVISAPVDGVYSAAGDYIITATDEAGNKNEKRFTVNDHDWATQTKKPTCAEEGSMQDVCALCGVKKEAITIPPTGNHTFTQDGIRHDAVCNINGYTTYHCVVCNQDIDVYDDPPTEGHNFKEIERVNPTCSSEGYALVQCSICEEVREIILPVNSNAHNYVEVERVEPTVYKEGYVKKECTYNHEHTIVNAIPKIPSFIIKVSVKDAHGSIVPNAKISVYENGKLILSGVTGDDGIDTLRFVKEGVYSFEIKANDYTTYTAEHSVVNGGSIVSMIDIELDHDSRRPDCVCTCHKDGFFAAIFRFFHKIAKLFVGSYNCCNDPDLNKYGK